MKWLMVTMLLNFAVGATASKLDTLPNWNFYFNKKIIMEGTSDTAAPGQAEIRLSAQKEGELMVTINYDIVSTFNSTLVIKREGQVIKAYQYTSNPSGIGYAPTLKTGSSFLIPVKDIVDQTSLENISLEFYYSDDHVTEKNLGTIAFSFDANEP